MKFGSREICDVVFKTTTDNQKIGQKTFTKAGTPCFMIDTAKTSSLEQATTTVYATGGKGNTRLLSWEGEKTMTFTVEDALISPMGLAVLSGAGLITASNAAPKHVHVTLNKNLDASYKCNVTLNDLKEYTGLRNATEFYICDDDNTKAYGTVIDGSGAGIDWIESITVSSSATLGTGDPVNTLVVDSSHDGVFTATSTYANKPIILDFYIVVQSGVSEIEIKPSDFGGYFYIEAQTLFRREDSGLDMPAEIILPKVKVQSGFTFSMASSGDPSTFTFTMDALPGYTKFDTTKKVCCVIQVIGVDDAASTTATSHESHAPSGN